MQPLEGAALARDACFPVFTVALGTPNGTIARGPFGGGGFNPGSGDSQRIPVPPDPETLRQIAEMTGGEFSEARTADALEKAYENLGSRLGREPGETEITFLLVALAAGLLLAAGVLGVARRAAASVAACLPMCADRSGSSLTHDDRLRRISPLHQHDHERLIRRVVTARRMHGDPEDAVRQRVDDRVRVADPARDRDRKRGCRRSGSRTRPARFAAPGPPCRCS